MKRGHPDRRCDGVTRREVLRAGALTALGLGLSDWLRSRSHAANPRPVSCILIWLDGGPSHIETFDPKPDAAAEVRGPFRAIATRVPGVQVSEHMPRTAALLGRNALVRPATFPLGEHNLGSHYVLTGYKPTPALVYPSYGSVVAKVRGGAPVLPPYVSVPDHVAWAGEGYLPGSCRPFAVGGDPGRPEFKVRDLDPFPGVNPGRLDRRQDFRQAFDQFRRDLETGEQDADFRQAYRLIGSPRAREAFDLTKESPATRARYGSRTLGQSCLLARRLVEAGVPFVTVTDRGWDTHDNLVLRPNEGYTGRMVRKVPTLDLALSALVEDLGQRGLLATTLVLVLGEFGRTPRLNTAGGRDHWPRVFSVALAGGGVKGGRVVGTSDARGEGPADGAVAPEDLARTIYHVLGVPASREFHTADGRPVPVNQGGKLIDLL